MSTNYSLRDLLNRKILILGEVGTGKTHLTANLLRQAAQAGFINKITVIDMAPRTLLVEGEKFGGCLRDTTGEVVGVRFLEALSNAPRLTGKTKEEILRLVRENTSNIEKLLKLYLASPTQLLFVNDVSIYLHSGELGLLPDVIAAADTFVGNGYFGRRLAPDRGTGVSQRERRAMLRLKDFVDEVIFLGGREEAS